MKHSAFCFIFCFRKKTSGGVRRLGLNRDQEWKAGLGKEVIKAKLGHRVYGRRADLGGIPRQTQKICAQWICAVRKREESGYLSWKTR